MCCVDCDAFGDDGCADDGLVASCPLWLWDVSRLERAGSGVEGSMLLGVK